MELLLQSRKNYIAMRRIRKIMITKEKLHIDEYIDKSRFDLLYSEYGKGLTEKDFARYVLDISYHKHYCLECGKTKKTQILSREYVSSKELETIRIEIKLYFENSPDRYIDYQKFEELYERFASKLSKALFAEEILGITYHSVECMKSDKDKKTKLFKFLPMDRLEIRKRQNEIISKEKLHIDDQIDRPQFYELYAKYGGDLSENEFALKILQIPASRCNSLKNGKNDYTIVFEKYVYSLEYIQKQREKVIKNEGLRINDLIDYSRFKELYQKYSGPLSEELFAEEILDINPVGVKNMRVSGSYSAILTEIDIPEEYVKYLRTVVRTENNLKQKQGLTVEDIEQLHQQYGGVLSQKMFACMILEISSDSYNSLMCGANQTSTILKSYGTDTSLKTRRQIVLENHLKIRGLIDYKTFKTYYEKYGGNERETIFAEKVLGIPVKTFYNLKYGSSKHVNILQDEQFPSEEELYNTKIKIGSDYNLHIKDKINYDKFSKIYKVYGGLLTEGDFAEKVLDISIPSLKKMVKNPEIEVQIFLKTNVNPEEIKKLRREVILDNNIYPERPISLSMFNKLYKSYEHILSEAQFASLILGIDKQCINKLKLKEYKTVRALLDEKNSYTRKRPYFNDNEKSLVKEALILGLNEEEIATKLFVPMKILKRNLDMLYRYDRLSSAEIEAERIARGIDSSSLVAKEVKPGDTRKKDQKESKKRLAEAEILRKKRAKIIDDFELTDEDMETIKKYIGNCKSRFVNGEFDISELPELKEAIVYIEGDANDIMLFVRISSSFGLYQEASKFICTNLNSSKMSNEEKDKLNKINNSINMAMKKKKAIEMISRGEKNNSEIIRKTGILEIDIIEMRKKLNAGQNVDISAWLDKSLDDD